MDFRKWVLAIAIAIVLNLFINYSVSVFYKEPKYEDFCRYNSPYPKIYPGEPGSSGCKTVETPESLRESCANQSGYIDYKVNSTGCPIEPYCEMCQTNYSETSNKRNSNVFVILVVAGVVAMIIGMSAKADAVATGFLMGGVLSFIIAAIRNWGQLADFLKLGILGAVLAILIWIGYKKLKA